MKQQAPKWIGLNIAVLLMTITPNSISAQNIPKMNNPLLQRSTLQYQAPAFDLIKNEHFKPAFEFGLKSHDKEVEQITNNAAHGGKVVHHQKLEIIGHKAAFRWRKLKLS